MSHVLHDLRSAVRSLLRSPGFAAVVVAVMAIAIGTNTTVFAVIDAVLLRALPYDDADSLVEVSLAIPPAEGLAERVAFLDRASLETWGQTSRTLSGLAPWNRVSVTLERGAHAERVTGVAASPELFSLLGASPILGRASSAAADGREREPVVVLSHGSWQRHFAGERDAIGRSLRLDGRPHRVIGVMPAAFFFPDDEVQLWMPLDRRVPGGDGQTLQIDYLPAVARLAPGAQIAEAEREAEAIIGALGGAPPGARVRLEPLREAILANVRPALVAIWLAVGLVLVAACVNLAGLLLARGAARRRELVIRSAIGGRRGRLFQQLLVQNMVLALAGGSLGVLLAVWGTRLVPKLAVLEIPRLGEVAFDGRSLVFALLVSTLAGVLYAFLPALQAARTPGIDTLRGGASTDEPSPTRLRKLLVVAQIAVATVLLVGSALLVGSFIRLVTVDPGYQPHGALLAELDLTAAGPGAAARLQPALTPLIDRIQGLSGVEGVGVMSVPPLAQRFTMTSVGIVGGPQQRTLAVPQRVSPGTLRAAGLRLSSGRWLDDREHAARAPVAIVNQTFASRYLGGGDPIGRRISAGTTTLEVIGVVDDVRLLGKAHEAKPELYLSYRTAAAAWGPDPGPVALVVRSRQSPDVLIPHLRSVVAELVPGIPLVRVERMDEQLAASTARPRAYALTLSCLAGIALALTALGLYSLLSHDVARQTRAIGVRRAVGAQARHVVGWVVWSALGWVAAGAVLGLLAAAAVSRFLSTILFGIGPFEIVGYAAALSIVLVVAALACYLPARRAARIDPLEALRFD